MNKVVTFVKESFEELKTGVSWPTYADLQNSALLVLLASLIFAVVIGLVDLAFKNGMNMLYQSIQ